MIIGLDLMGGDYAPFEPIKGLGQYIQKAQSQASFVCFGDEALVSPLLDSMGISSPRITIVHCSQNIGYQDAPTKAFKEKPDSSLAVGFKYLQSGKVDSLLSAGNTGAILVGALFSIKAVEGVLRPMVTGFIPKTNGDLGVLGDVGLNADCKPEYLNQFALLATLYVKNILGKDDVKVGLVNVGEEEGKGNMLAQATYPLLKENPKIHFIGNIEGRDMFNEKADVMVCDGYTGNIVLKIAETFYDLTQFRGYLNDPFFYHFHYEIYGGSPVLGIHKPVIIGHGISKATAFYNMFTLAEKMIQTDLCGKIKESFKI